MEAPSSVLASAAALNEAVPGSVVVDAQSVLRIRTRTQDHDVLLAMIFASVVGLIVFTTSRTQVEPWLVFVAWAVSLCVVFGHAAIGFRTEIEMDGSLVVMRTWRRRLFRDVHHVRVIQPRKGGPPFLRLSTMRGAADIHLCPLGHVAQQLAAVMNSYLVWRAAELEERSSREDPRST